MPTLPIKFMDTEKKTSPLLVKKLVSNAVMPTRATEGAAGYDLASVEKIVVPSLGRAMIPLGLGIQVPSGTYGRIAPRSGLAFKYGIDVLAGVIDEDYRSEVKVILYNTGERDYIVNPGDRVAQLIIEKIETPDVATVVEFEESARGSGGFGSTGV
jgi:dUTP pyrophosphatase